MKLPEEGLLLRVYVGEADQYRGRALYEQIVFKARELNMAGATVLRGMMGFGAASRIHTARYLRLSEDLPVVVEIIDTEERIRQILPFLDETVREGLVTMEKVRIIKYRHEASDEAG